MRNWLKDVVVLTLLMVLMYVGPVAALAVIRRLFGGTHNAIDLLMTQNILAHGIVLYVLLHVLRRRRK